MAYYGLWMDCEWCDDLKSKNSYILGMGLRCACYELRYQMLKSTLILTITSPLIPREGFISSRDALLVSLKRRWVCRETSMATGREIAPNTGANATKFFTLATKSWKLVAKLATRTFHHNLTKRNNELKRFAKINPRQTSSLSLFLKRSTCFSIDN